MFCIGVVSLLRLTRRSAGRGIRRRASELCVRELIFWKPKKYLIALDSLPTLPKRNSIETLISIQDRCSVEKGAFYAAVRCLELLLLMQPLFQKLERNSLPKSVRKCRLKQGAIL